MNSTWQAGLRLESLNFATRALSKLFRTHSSRTGARWAASKAEVGTEADNIAARCLYANVDEPELPETFVLYKFGLCEA